MSMYALAHRFCCLSPIGRPHDSELSVYRLELQACVEPGSSRAVNGGFGARKPSSRPDYLVP
ncbi:hypothetical protein B0H19DRAFT_1385699 [Mycena capillaripes]|nr:hypothetical protein B0H19DRAFT_1385699 [Mycena capillaripes]